MKFLPLDQTDEDAVNDILMQIDTCLQYGEDQEPREMRVGGRVLIREDFFPFSLAQIHLLWCLLELHPQSWRTC